MARHVKYLLINKLNFERLNSYQTELQFRVIYYSLINILIWNEFTTKFIFEFFYNYFEFQEIYNKCGVNSKIEFVRLEIISANKKYNL